MLKPLLEKLCEKLNLAFDPTEDPEGFLTLNLNKDMAFQLKDQNPGFYSKAVIGSAPEGSHEDFYKHYMKANFLGRATGGCALALTPDVQHLMLILSVNHDVNEQELKNYLETYANYLDYWKTHLKKYKLSKNA